jgi:hypothetical protein
VVQRKTIKSNNAGRNVVIVKRLAQIIRPGNIVKGRIFSNDDSRVRIAIERGAASIVTRPVLPALLAAAHAAQETGKPE